MKQILTLFSIIAIPYNVFASPTVKIVGEESQNYGFPEMLGAGINIEALVQEVSERSSYAYVDEAYSCGEQVKVLVGDAEVWTKISCYDLGDGLFMYKEDKLDRCGLTATSGNHTPLELSYLARCTETIINPLRENSEISVKEVLKEAGVVLDLEKIRSHNY